MKISLLPHKSLFFIMCINLITAKNARNGINCREQNDSPEEKYCRGLSWEIFLLWEQIRRSSAQSDGEICSKSKALWTKELRGRGRGMNFRGGCRNESNELFGSCQALKAKVCLLNVTPLIYFPHRTALRRFCNFLFGIKIEKPKIFRPLVILQSRWTFCAVAVGNNKFRMEIFLIKLSSAFHLAQMYIINAVFRWKTFRRPVNSSIKY